MKLCSKEKVNMNKAEMYFAKSFSYILTSYGTLFIKSNYVFFL